MACEQVELVDVWEFLESYIVEGLTSSWYSEPVKSRCFILESGVLVGVRFSCS